MNPQTGAILAMSGFHHDLATGEVTPNPLAPILNSEVPGSVVKGVILTAGYETGVIKGNDVLTDEAILLAVVIQKLLGGMLLAEQPCN